jgi:hypothetical protein
VNTRFKAPVVGLQAGQVIAVSKTDFEEHGCITCGARGRGYHVSARDAGVSWCCTDRSRGKPCDQVMHILEDGVTVSPIKVGGRYPRLQEHPRADSALAEEVRLALAG